MSEKELTPEELADQIMRWDWRDEFREGNKKAIKEMFEAYQGKVNNGVLDDVVGSADFEDDTIMTDEEIEWHEEQERKARKAGMTSEQILNGEHHDIIF